MPRFFFRKVCPLVCPCQPPGPAFTSAGFKGLMTLSSCPNWGILFWILMCCIEAVRIWVPCNFACRILWARVSSSSCLFAFSASSRIYFLTSSTSWNPVFALISSSASIPVNSWFVFPASICLFIFIKIVQAYFASKAAYLTFRTLSAWAFCRLLTT